MSAILNRELVLFLAQSRFSYFYKQWSHMVKHYIWCSFYQEISPNSPLLLVSIAWPSCPQTSSPTPECQPSSRAEGNRFPEWNLSAPAANHVGVKEALSYNWNHKGVRTGGKIITYLDNSQGSSPASCENAMGNVMTTCGKEDLAFLPDLISKVKAGHWSQGQKGPVFIIYPTLGSRQVLHDAGIGLSTYFRA